MATKAVQGKFVAIYVDGLNASPFLQEFEVDSSRDDTDVTPVESDSKSHHLGRENDVTLTGSTRASPTAWTRCLFNSYGGTVDNVVTIFPGGTTRQKCLLVPALRSA